MASFYFLQNLTQKYTLANCCTVRFSKHGKRKRCQPASKGYRGGEGRRRERYRGGEGRRREHLLAGKRTASFIFWFVFSSRISGTKKQENNDSTHQGQPLVMRWTTYTLLSRLTLRLPETLGGFRPNPSPLQVGTAEPSQRYINTDPTNLIHT